jgi:hypothetical protein
MHMHILLAVVLSVVAGENYSGTVMIDGIGDVALPSGKWQLEQAVTTEKKDRPDIYVFKKLGDRLERLTFQKFEAKIAHPVSNYVDSIGDGMSNGIPVSLLNYKSEHETTFIIRPLFNRNETSVGGSFIYTSEKHHPWMSHYFVCQLQGGVVVCVHSSPHVLSPDTVEDLYDGLQRSKKR